MSGNKSANLYSSILEYRIRQLAPAAVFAYPLIWRYQSFLLDEDNNKIIVIAICLFYLIFLSFITETFGDMIERRIFKWCLKLKCFNGKERNAESEWYEYLRRECSCQLIGDKYLGDLVERMKLRCSLLIPVLLTASYGGYESWAEHDCTESIIYLSVGFGLCSLL
jgi:hypothetical protein